MAAATAAQLEPEITLPWLIRLRWMFLAGQALALLVGWRIGVALSWPPFVAGLVVGAGSNAVLALGLRSRRARWSTAPMIGGLLLLDTALLTVLLAAAGGPMNPFTVLYLVYITLSAVVLSARWTALVALLCASGFGLLFVLPTPGGGAADPHAGHAGHAGHAMPGAGDAGFEYHLQGMWVAFVLATGLTAFFVGRISRAIAAQREQIAQLREAGARNARLAALTTLAAGAAHELGSPLSTIAVAAHEAALRAARLPECEPLAEDLRLILLECDRCPEILGKMGARAAATEDDAEPLDAATLVERIRDHLGEARAARVTLTAAAPRMRLRVPSEQLVQSIVAMIRNALDASGPDERVVVEISEGPDAVRIAVVDRGAGIPAELLPRIGEPFFTTKQPGRGLGLGVFLARAFFESRGGGLTIESLPGVGTRTTMHLPMQGATA